MSHSFAAYAAHRSALNLPGQTASAVRKAIRTRRIEVSADGGIEDFQRADAEWAWRTSGLRRPKRMSPPPALEAEMEHGQENMEHTTATEAESETEPLCYTKSDLQDAGRFYGHYAITYSLGRLCNQANFEVITTGCLRSGMPPAQVREFIPWLRSFLLSRYEPADYLRGTATDIAPSPTLRLNWKALEREAKGKPFTPSEWRFWRWLTVEGDLTEDGPEPAKPMKGKRSKS